MAQSVIEVHREHLSSHRFVQKYASGYEYLQHGIGISESEIPEEYRNVHVELMFRIHTDSPRQYMIIQKNPNLKESWVSGGIHHAHAHLTEWNGDRLERNIEHSRTSVSSYLDNSRLQIILQHLADEIGGDQFEFGPSIEEYGFDRYLRMDVNREYDSSADSPIIGPDEGFYGDFAYSNAMKFQGPTDKVSPESDDDEWLRDEIAAVGPNLILALGVPARESLQRIGFEQIDYSGPFYRDEGKVYTYNGSDPDLQGMSAIGLYHFGSREPHDELKRVLGGSIRAALNDG